MLMNTMVNHFQFSLTSGRHNLIKYCHEDMVATVRDLGGCSEPI